MTTTNVLTNGAIAAAVVTDAIVRLLPSPRLRIAGGRILLEGRDLVALDGLSSTIKEFDTRVGVDLGGHERITLGRRPC